MQENKLIENLRHIAKTEGGTIQVGSRGKFVPLELSDTEWFALDEIMLHNQKFGTHSFVQTVTGCFDIKNLTNAKDKMLKELQEMTSIGFQFAGFTIGGQRGMNFDKFLMDRYHERLHLQWSCLANETLVIQ